MLKSSMLPVYPNGVLLLLLSPYDVTLSPLPYAAMIDTHPSFLFYHTYRYRMYVINVYCIYIWYITYTSTYMYELHSFILYLSHILIHFRISRSTPVRILTTHHTSPLTLSFTHTPPPTHIHAHTLSLSLYPNLYIFLLIFIFCFFCLTSSKLIPGFLLEP